MQAAGRPCLGDSSEGSQPRGVEGVAALARTHCSDLAGSWGPRSGFVRQVTQRSVGNGGDGKSGAGGLVRVTRPWNPGELILALRQGFSVLAPQLGVPGISLHHIGLQPGSPVSLPPCGSSHSPLISKHSASSPTSHTENYQTCRSGGRAAATGRLLPRAPGVRMRGIPSSLAVSGPCLPGTGCCPAWLQSRARSLGVWPGVPVVV